MVQPLTDNHAHRVVEEIDQDVANIRLRIEQRQREQDEDQRDLEQLLGFRSYWLKRHPEAGTDLAFPADGLVATPAVDVEDGESSGPNLRQALLAALGSAEKLTVSEAYDAVLRLGWRTTSKVPKTRVRNTLNVMIEAKQAAREGDFYCLLAPHHGSHWGDQTPLALNGSGAGGGDEITRP